MVDFKSDRINNAHGIFGEQPNIADKLGIVESYGKWVRALLYGFSVGKRV